MDIVGAKTNLQPIAGRFEEWPRGQEGEWCTEKIQHHFFTQIHKRFIDDRFAWLAHRDAENVHFFAENGYTFREWCTGKGIPETGLDYENEDAPSWQFFESLFFDFSSNTARIIYPFGACISSEQLAMFDNTDMAWSKPFVNAITHDDGTARIQVEIMLVAEWTDAQQAKWEYEKTAERVKFL